MSIDEIVQRIGAHSFPPVDNGFTVDPDTGYDGVPNHERTDWRVRTLALRDLIRQGRKDIAPLVDLLEHDNPHVRQVTTMGLGPLRAERAVGPLENRLRHDPEPVVRAHAAIALGQIGVPSDAVAHHAETENHPDVRHQCMVARSRIERGRPVEPAVAEQFATLDPSTFGRVRDGDFAPDFVLDDTEGRSWRLSDVLGEKTVVLLWVFADWCPVCHKEFHELIRRKDRFRALDVEVATLECHDRYRGRVMTGKEIRPPYWFADKLPGEHPLDPYPDEIWWPHLVDRAASVGLRYGIDPWQFAVHSEWVNRPSTVIIDSEGIVRLAYVGTYWGDRPSIGQILDMIETGTYNIDPPPPQRGPH
ncbi:HEAT repeat domain-containing protein [Salinibacter altiplanensis]|uniref:HEAT repeat domain-containing protein n=1 Tax=Salinibacter altiplanensis TaxID=1803181 RepID=UPI000C9FD840|nr:HEAT repeat domain-containing protein [Salinibacter altiplanensis]